MMISNALKDVSQYSDAELIRGILSGNTSLFEVLIRKYNPALYKTGRGYGFSHHDTEDLMQETYINSYQSLSKFENRSTFKSWIIRIMLNQCYHKKHKPTKNVQTIAGYIQNNSKDMPVKFIHNDTGKSVLNKELNKIIEASIDKLPEDYRLTFTLRELTGFSVAETAEVLQTTQTNVKVRLNRAKTMLRKEIEKNYSSEEIFEFNLIYCNKIVSEVMKKIELLNPA